MLCAGGVYADADTNARRPTRRWNCEHNFDAEALIGVEAVVKPEQVAHMRMAGVLSLCQFLMAAKQGHPLFRWASFMLLTCG